MKKLVILLSWFLPISLLLTACGTESEPTTQDENENKRTIYTTVYPLQYFAEEIGGDLVNVETIYPPGSDEHTFEPSQKDMMKLADSDLFIYVGLGLEGFVNKAKESLANENVKLLAAGENIPFENYEEEGSHDEHEEATHEEEEEDHAHSHGDIDPHVWLDPIYASHLAKSIKEELITLLPEHKEELETNFQELTTELDSLNKKFATTIQEAKHKEIIVSHAAYGYWEKRYGLKQINISGLISSDEPTQKELQEIISTATKYDLKYIFFEQNGSSKSAKVVQKEINAQPLFLHNLSVLTDDDISEDRTYFTIMEDNLKALEKALND